ncbi:MAG: sensor domain-containing diguanylate cyclase [Gammaproteobacteria bacterium]|nr:sensor domain-containing diguanylate cyclase [Gammaproteobacteria bacterium]
MPNQSNSLLERFLDVTKQLMSAKNTDNVLDIVAQTSMDLSESDAVVVHLFDFNKGILEVRKLLGMNLNQADKTLTTLGRAIFNEVIRCGESLENINYDVDHTSGNEELATQAQSTLTVPLKDTSISLGAITVLRYNDKPFSKMQVESLEKFAAIAAHAIEKARLIRELEKQVTHDALTGLHNKKAIISTLKVEMERSKRHGETMALMFLDLDNFKAFNDTYGHLVGDKLIFDIANLLKRSCRKIDTIGRFGGDEFVIIAPKTSAADAEKIGEKLIKNIERFQFGSTVPRRRIHIKASIGIALHYPSHRISAEELMQRADMAMLAAKREGKNRVLVADALMQLENIQQIAH